MARIATAEDAFILEATRWIRFPIYCLNPALKTSPGSYSNAPMSQPEPAGQTPVSIRTDQHKSLRPSIMVLSASAHACASARPHFVAIAKSVGLDEERCRRRAGILRY
ncbi:MAG TPA: hypothetical protein VFE67_02590 [Rudaea sp.]|nr:hypothetical protein [Rudaea sp.]